jgi:hypothetical protein
MANLQSLAALGQKPVPTPFEAVGGMIVYDYVFGATAPALNDTIELGNIDPAIQVVDYVVYCDDIDSNGVPTIAFSLGQLNAGKTALDTGTAVWQTAIASGQAGVPQRASQNTNHLTTTGQVGQALTKLALQVTAIAATYAGSGKRISVVCFVRPVGKL